MVLHNEVELSIDAVFVCKIPFLVAIVHNLQYRTCHVIPDKSGLSKREVFHEVLDKTL